MMGDNASEQITQVFFAQTRLVQYVAQGAGTDFAVQRDDGAVVACDTAPFEGNVAAFLPQHYKASSPQGANQLTAGNRRQMPAHAPTSMLVR